MSNNDFEFNLDDILAEFHASEQEYVQPEPVRPAAKPVAREKLPLEIEAPAERRAEPARVEVQPEEWPEPVRTKTKVQPKEWAEPVKKAEGGERVDKIKRMSPEEKLESYKRAEAARRASAEKRAAEKYSSEKKAADFEELFEAKPSVKKAKAEKPRYEEEYDRKPASGKRANGTSFIISVCAFAVLMVWGIFNVHPGASLPKPSPSPVAPTPVVTAAPVATPDVQSGTEGETDVTEPEVPAEPPKPHYTIPEGSVLAPKANPANFGSVPVANASELDAVIQQARDSGLLREDEKMVFDSSLAFNTGSYYQDIKYYYDETTLAIAWKQIVDGNTVTCMEVKVADASQFRRKITGDTYGSPVDYLSNLNKSTNAVVSMNADFYQFRDYGVMVYDGILYKCTDKRYLVHNGVDYKWYNCLDNCFITRDGDMIFTYFGEEFTWDSMQQFVDDNNISFSLSFGPILVDNYEAQTHYADWYPVGEVDQGYSRAGFGQLDERHYLYMSLNHSDEKSARWTMLEFGQFFQSRGVEKAYAFDGGQTSEIIFNGEIYNHIDKSSERWVSDMVYFGTALPEEVWNNG